MSCMTNICGSAMYAVTLCNYKERKREGERIRLHWESWAIDSSTSVEPRRVKISEVYFGKGVFFWHFR